MFNIEAPGVATQNGGIARPPKLEDVTSALLAKQPSTQTVAPEQAVVPVQSSAEGQSVKAQVDDVKDLVERINERLDAYDPVSSTSVRFAVDDRLDELVVSVVDRQTDEVVRQIPAEYVLERMSRMEDLKGLLVNAES